MHPEYVMSRKQGKFQLVKAATCAVDIEKGNS